MKLAELAKATEKGAKLEEEGDPFGDAIEEAWTASKKDDAKGFARAMKSAVRIAMNLSDKDD